MAKTYTAEQKAEALKKVEELGLSKAARELGISIGSLSKWKATTTSVAEKTKAKAKEVADQAAATEIEVKKEGRAAGRKGKETLTKAAEEVKEKAEEAISDAAETAEAVKAVTEETAAKAAKETKAKVQKAAEKVKAAKITMVVQNPFGGNITTEEIAKKLPEGCDSVFIRVDQNKLWWVKGEETGSVDIW